jgi:hypothetical protein
MLLSFFMLWPHVLVLITFNSTNPLSCAEK